MNEFRYDALLILTYGILNGFGQTFYYPSATSLISQLHAESRAIFLPPRRTSR